jgi:peptidyl-prolyl cis-trans isomerase D
LDTIEAGTVAPGDPLFAQTKQELSQAIQQELGAQMRLAIQKEFVAERNEAAIEAVRKQLTGTN